MPESWPSCIVRQLTWSPTCCRSPCKARPSAVSVDNSSTGRNNTDEFTITIRKKLYLFHFILKKKTHPLTVTLSLSLIDRYYSDPLFRFQQVLDMQERVVCYPSRLHIFAAVRAFFCYYCGGATPRAYKVLRSGCAAVYCRRLAGAVASLLEV